jgi:predicted phage-related endonuclease
MVTALQLLDKPSWLAERRQGVFASDSRVLFGYGFADESPLGLYVEKTDPEAEEQKSVIERLEVGLALQPGIINLVRRRTGYDVKPTPDFCIHRSDSKPWMGATTDSLVYCPRRGHGVGEIKNVGIWEAAEWEADEPPLSVHIQVQHQMYVLGAAWGFAAALIGGQRLVIKEVTPNRRFVEAALLPTCQRFWDRVQVRCPPPPDDSEAASRALARLYRETTGETVALDQSAITTAERLQKARRLRLRLDKIERGLANELKAAIGEAEVGLLPNGDAWEMKRVHRAAYEVAESDYLKLGKLSEKKSPDVLDHIVRSLTSGGATLRAKSPSGSVYFDLPGGRDVRVADHRLHQDSRSTTFEIRTDTMEWPDNLNAVISLLNSHSKRRVKTNE